MAKVKGKSAAVASLNPDDMLQGGLPTDFRGTVTEAVYTKFDYEGAADEPVLAVRLTIKPADGEDVNQGKDVVQHWSAGNLKDWAPGDEDEEPADEGLIAVRVGKRPQMNNNTNFAHLMRSILESGEAAKGKPFTRKMLTNEITCLVGLDAHWDRVPQEKRKGMVDLKDDEDEDGDEKKSRPSKRDILVVTEVFGYDPDGAAETPAPKKKPKSAAEEEETEEAEDEEEQPKKKPAKKPPVEEDESEETEAEETEAEEAEAEEEAEEDPFDAALSKAIAKEVKKAGGSLKKGKLAALMLKAYATAKPKDKTKAVERATEEEFLSDGARPWEFDEDTGVLTIE